jgi:hypothetical protein
MKTTVARWESKSGKHWVNLYRSDNPALKGYGFDSPDIHGWFGDIGEEQAIRELQRRLDTFQPSRNKTPMLRMPL